MPYSDGGICLYTHFSGLGLVFIETVPSSSRLTARFVDGPKRNFTCYARGRSLAVRSRFKFNATQAKKKTKKKRKR